jgi:arylsulfatase A-like enzyme
MDAKLALVDEFQKTADATKPQHHPLYAAMIKSLDDAVGTLVRTLDENGLTDRTLVVFFSDNGGINWRGHKFAPNVPAELASKLADLAPTSNAPLRGGKASIYEGGTREPCLVVWPGVVQPGRTTEALVQSIDFYPTLAEAAGAALPVGQKMDGRSFMPLLTGTVDEHRDRIFCFFPHNTPASGQVPAVSVRRGDWKLIRFFHDGPRQADRHELYNLKSDPGETKDLAADEAGRVGELSKLLDGFLKETGALVPGANPRFAAAASE